MGGYEWNTTVCVSVGRIYFPKWVKINQVIHYTSIIIYLAHRQRLIGQVSSNYRTGSNTMAIAADKRSYTKVIERQTTHVSLTCPKTQCWRVRITPVFSHYCFVKAWPPRNRARDVWFCLIYAHWNETDWLWWPTWLCSQKWRTVQNIPGQKSHAARSLMESWPRSVRSRATNDALDNK